MTAVDFLNFLMSDPELAPKELVISGRNKERKEVFAKFASTESNAKLLGNKDKMPVTLLEGTVNRCEGPNSFSTSTGALVEGVDGVIFATGYRLNFPFLDEKDDILQLRENRTVIYPVAHTIFSANVPQFMIPGMCFNIVHV